MSAAKWANVDAAKDEPTADHTACMHDVADVDGISFASGWADGSSSAAPARASGHSSGWAGLLATADSDDELEPPLEPIIACVSNKG